MQTKITLTWLIVWLSNYSFELCLEYKNKIIFFLEEKLIKLVLKYAYFIIFTE